MNTHTPNTFISAIPRPSADENQSHCCDSSWLSPVLIHLDTTTKRRCKCHNTLYLGNIGRNQKGIKAIVSLYNVVVTSWGYFILYSRYIPVNTIFPGTHKGRENTTPRGVVSSNGQHIKREQEPICVCFSVFVDRQGYLQEGGYFWYSK